MQILKAILALLFGKNKNHEQYLAFAQELLSGNLDEEMIRTKVMDYIGTTALGDQKNLGNVLNGLLTDSQTTGNPDRTQALEMILRMLNSNQK